MDRAWVFGWRLIRVRGASMTPTLSDGDYVLVRRPDPRRSLREGEVVCVRRAGAPLMIKRLGRRDTASGRFSLWGDGIGSAPSVDLGTAGPAEIVGRAVLGITGRRVFRLRRRTLGSPTAG